MFVLVSNLLGKIALESIGLGLFFLSDSILDLVKSFHKIGTIAGTGRVIVPFSRADPTFYVRRNLIKDTHYEGVSTMINTQMLCFL